MQAGLSFDQAPPFTLPLRFFLTAPLFLLTASVLIALAPEALTSRWTPAALALTHALTLGFLAMVMLGALMQMLPVVAGATLPAAPAVAVVSHTALTLGTATLMAAFLTAEPLTYVVGAGLFGLAFVVFLAAAGLGLARAMPGATVEGMRLATASLALTLLLGVTLALLRGGSAQVLAAGSVLAAHAGFGLLGWILLLVVGVAYQVVPMFQMTPPYPPRLTRWLGRGLFALLLAHAALPWLPQPAPLFIDGGLALGTLTFAVATLRLQARRRRKLPDVTLDFWRLGMASLILGVVAWLLAQVLPAWATSERYPLLLGVLFLGGFAVSVVSGMLYKIVPFLAWFHLQAQLQARAGSIPTMKDMIGERAKRIQFRFHLVACGLLAAALIWPPLARAAGGALALSALLLWVNLLSGVRRFARHGGHFS